MSNIMKSLRRERKKMNKVSAKHFDDWDDELVDPHVREGAGRVREIDDQLRWIEHNKNDIDALLGAEIY